jgi:undecaprenyl diphosphate synthase
MENVPQSVAIILDGNGRWAKKRGMPRTYGHMMGAKNVEPVCRAADALGIKYLTFYAFSTENWKRSKDEVSTLMKLIVEYLNKLMKLSVENNMRVFIIGDVTGLSPEMQDMIRKVEDISKDFTGMTLSIALNYGSRDEIVRGIRKMVEDPKMKEAIARDGVEKAITEEKFSTYLDTKNIPDPDLMIRTSGEERLSNFLLWQLAYSEFYFTDVAWPDFNADELKKACEEYARRNRRFGGV